jgi:hypothetical protein
VAEMMGYMSESSNLSLISKDLPHTGSKKVTTFTPILKDFMALRRAPSTAASSEVSNNKSERGNRIYSMQPPSSTMGSTSGGSNDHDNRKIPAIHFSNTDSIRSITDDNLDDEHRPLCLPQFRHPNISMWTAAHAANSPSEDRSASLVNVLLQPLPNEFDDSETQLPPLDHKTLIRLNLWSVIDGHGGGAVATYASEVCAR